VKTEPCRATTGRSPLGTHLLLKTPDGETVNAHLGPAAAVEFLTKDLSRGMEVKLEAFRTTKTQMGQYIVRSLTFGDRTVELRDENLRPAWAGGRAFKKRPEKIAVTAVEPSLDAAVDPRFGRCRYFVVVDAQEGSFEVLDNTNAARRGAGVESARTLQAKGVSVVLTGKCGPSASRALSQAGIQVVAGCSGTVGAAIEQFKARHLEPVSDSNAAPLSERSRRSGAGKRDGAGPRRSPATNDRKTRNGS
jgi:predicted Fe-Mo cluster-binding NifX family protein